MEAGRMRWIGPGSLDRREIPEVRAFRAVRSLNPARARGRARTAIRGWQGSCYVLMR